MEQQAAQASKVFPMDILHVIVRQMIEHFSCQHSAKFFPRLFGAVGKNKMEQN